MRQEGEAISLSSEYCSSRALKVVRRQQFHVLNWAVVRGHNASQHSYRMETVGGGGTPLGTVSGWPGCWQPGRIGHLSVLDTLLRGQDVLQVLRSLRSPVKVRAVPPLLHTSLVSTSRGMGV